MSQEHTSQLKDNSGKVKDRRIESVISDTDVRFNGKINSHLTSPSLKCANIDHIDDSTLKENVYSMTLNMHPQSNSHTPLLSSGTIPDNDIENITDMEDLDVENNEKEKEKDFDNASSNTEQNSEFDPAFKGEITETQEDENEQEMSTILQSSPFQILELRRELFKNTQVKKQTGLKYYYIDREWLTVFLNKEFKEDDLQIDNVIGPVKTIPFDQSLNEIVDSFIVLDQFKLLLEWFQLENNNQLIERELIYSTTEDKFIIDLHPLTIIPHIFCNNASQVNRFKQIQNRNHTFQISSFRTVADLFSCMLSYFDLTQIHVSSTRIWCVELDSTHSPLVLIPSALKYIKKRKLVSKKRKRSATLRQRHITSCHLMLEIKQPDGIFFLDIDSHVLLGSGLVGLNNLGNTCYMNSALQCLVHIPELNSYFLYHFFENELNKDNPLGNKGKVAISFGSLVTSLFDDRFNGNQSSFSPKEFKYTIGHFNSLFADYRQQDSQEFIAYLLDGLHEDLNRVLKKPYVEKPELEVGKEDNMEAITNLAEKCWEAHKMRNNSVIVDLFVALYKSTLICPVCDRVSITFDPYNDLTLPLPITKKWTHKIKILPENGIPKIFEAQLSRNETYSDLKRLISKYMDIQEENLIGVEIFRNSIYKNFEDSTSDSRYLPISELISSGEDVWFFEVEKIEGNAIIPVFSTVVSNSNRNNFCLPFFISLSPEDRFSYGTIQKKMVRKYKQLSTSELFVKIDEGEDGGYTRKNFEGIELFFKYLGVNTPSDEPKTEDEVIKSNADTKMIEANVSDDDDKSTISLASPDYTLENIFSSKVVNSSLEKNYYGRNTTARSFERSSSNSNKSSLDFWFPENNNTIIKHDLPSLLDGMSTAKKCYYLYGPENLRMLEEHYEKLDCEQVKSKDQDDESIDSKQKAFCPSDNVEMMDGSDTPNTESKSLEDVESECDIDEESKDPNFVQKSSSINTNDDINVPTKEQNDGSPIDQYFTATENIVSGNSDVGLHKSANVLQSGDHNDKLVSSSSSSISPVSTSSASSPSVPSSSSLSIAKDVCSVTNDSSEDRKPLIEPMSAIVNEFRENSFDLCFCNPSDSPFSGSETWSSPEKLVNDDLERERTENLENARKPVTLYDCLELFSKPETLGENDLWYCPQCKEHRQATKKIELWSAPDILTIHLKRFESTQSFSDKIDIVVDFPIEGLDLNKFVADQNGEHVYDLFAVDNHYGGLGGGHYTAYVKNFADGKWHYFNDSRVTPVNDPAESISGNAYLLFYRKRSRAPLGGDYFHNMMIEIQKRNSELKKAIDDSQVKQASSTSTLETSDEEMHTSETSESSENFEETQPGNGGTAERNIKNSNDDCDDESEIDADDGNKRRKLGVSSTIGEPVRNNRGNDVATIAEEGSASSTDTSFTPISN